MRSLTVYCASSPHVEPVFFDAAAATGKAMAEHGLRLVYGGGGIGLMGVLARSVQHHGGAVTGIIPNSLLEREQGYDGCDELIVVETMQERKRKMMDMGDGFLALAGGLGTWEELLEVITARVVGEHTKPIGLLDTEGYYDPLLELFEHGIEHKFVKPAVLDLMNISADPAEVVAAIIGSEPKDIDDSQLLPMGDDFRDGRESSG